VLEVTPRTVSRTKLIAACFLLLGGLAAGLGPAIMGSADAQGPPAGGTPGGYAAGPVAPPGGSGDPNAVGGEGGVSATSADGGGAMMHEFPSGNIAVADGGRTRWEYEFAAKPRSLQEFRNVLRRFGEQGWEFAGVESFEEPRPAGQVGPGGAGSMPPGGMTSTMVVFKRPVRGAVARGGAGGARYGSGGMSSSPGTGGSNPYMPSASGMSAPGGGRSPGPGMFDPVMQPGERGVGAGGFKVVALKHASALDLVATLKQLYGNVQIVGDSRSNSIILKAEPAAAREIEELIRRLDVPGSDEASGAGGGPPRPGGGGR
jgi:hypothetical protein